MPDRTDNRSSTSDQSASAGRDPELPVPQAGRLPRVVPDHPVKRSQTCRFRLRRILLGPGAVPC